MHPQIYAQRIAVAQDKLTEQACAVAERFGIEPANLKPLPVIARDPELLRLFQLEAVGEFLECLALAQEPVHTMQQEATPPAEQTPADKSYLYVSELKHTPGTLEFIDKLAAQTPTKKKT